MYVFGEPVLSAYTIFDYHPAIFESYSNLREDLYFFPTTFHFRILSYTLWVESPVHGVQTTTLRFSSFHALSCDPSHISHSYQSLLYQDYSYSPFSVLPHPSLLPCAEVPFLPDYSSPSCVLPYLPLLVVVPSLPDCCSFVLCSPCPTSCLQSLL